MKWVVGIDARPGHAGALEFARWLRSRGTEHEFVAVHVVQMSAATKALVGAPPEVELRASGEAVLRYAIKEAGVDDWLTDTRVVISGAIDQGLSQIAAEESAHGIIVGRHARADESSFVRLGGVGRELLRRADGAVAIVPPEFSSESPTRGGPVLMPHDLRGTHRSQIEFSAQLAKDVGLECVPGFVNHELHRTVSYIPADAFNLLRDEAVESGRSALSAFMAEHAPTLRPGHVVCGDIVSAIAGLTSELRAPLVCVGKRRIGGLAQLWTHSVSTELAATIDAPVVVIPDAG